MPAQGPGSATRTLIHRGRKFDLESIEVTGPGGHHSRHDIIRHPGAAVILPILDDGRIVLIRNHRPSVDRPLLELPAGTLEPSEPPEVCAGRELIEETGYRAATIRPLGRFYSSPGMSDEMMWAFAATGLIPVGQKLEPDERVTVHPVAAAEALGMIDSGEMVDGKSMLILLLGVRKGLIRA